MRANALAIMAKVPIPGQVKTRLTPFLSPEEAAELYRSLFFDQIESLLSFGRADLFIAFAPEGAAVLFQEPVPSDFVCFLQSGGDLGDRMYNALIHLSTQGYRNIVLIGSDAPALPSRFLDEAFGILEQGTHDLVLGPSRDGGYYLIGMSRPVPEIFQGIPWSSDRVLETTTQKLVPLGLRAHLLSPWFDVDTVGDLQYLQSVADQLEGGAGQRTLRFLKNRS